MKKKQYLRAAAVFAFMVFTATSLFGQAVSNAQIHGRVTDSTGAALPNAQIKVTQTSTGMVRTTLSGPEGSYFIPNLPVGPYELEVTASGFQAYVQKGIVLQVGENPEISVSLSVGAVRQTVEVTANAVMVESQQTSVSEVIDQRRIVDLPLNGREPIELVILSGGATSTRPSSDDLVSTKNYGNTGSRSSGGIDIGASRTVSIAGGQANGTNYLLDGGDNNDAFSNVSLPFPFPDAIQEFSVQTSTLSSRYGLHPGGAVNFVTKSGGNGFHGDAFEFLRNNAVNAKNFFFDPVKNPEAQDTLKRNQFGGTLGGPILRDKLFFFGGYQGTRNRQVPVGSQVFVLTQDALNGDFSKLESTACTGGKATRTIVDPTKPGKPLYVNSQVPTAEFNPQALNLLKFVPVSTDPCGSFRSSIPVTGDEDQVIDRVDWIVSAKHSVFGRYFIADFSDPAVFDGKNILTSTKPGQLSRSQSLVLGDTYTLTSTIINSLHVTGTRLRINRGTAPDMINPSSLGINMPSPVPNSLVLTVSNGFTVEGGSATPGHFNNNAFQVADDADVVRGRHQLAFGVDWIHNQLNYISNVFTNGQFDFNGSATRQGGASASTSGDPLLDFLLGFPDSFTQGNPEAENWRQTYWGLYIQDSYKVRPSLTLNAGLRWEPYLPAADIFHRGSHFDPAAFAAGTTSTVFPGAPPGLFYCGDPQTPCAYINRHLANFEPRMGLAWDPTHNGRMTVRAGYGLFYDSPEIFYFDRFADNSPYGSQIGITNPTGGLTNPYQGQTVPKFPTPFPPTATNAFFPDHGVFVSVPADLRPTYTQQWNLSVQRQAGANWLFTVSYLGNKTTHIWTGFEANPAVFIAPANPNCPATSIACSSTKNTEARRKLTLQNPAAGVKFQSISQTDDGGNASYHGLLLSANHRFSQNFSVLANYAYSHCISDGDFAGELSNSRLRQDPNNRRGERGNCGFDHRQLFNASFVATSPKFRAALAQHILGNWQFSGILSKNTGDWISATLGSTDNSLTGIKKDRPNASGNPNISHQTLNQWFNTGVFSQSTAGTFGNAGRNIVEGPGSFDFGASIARQFKTLESQSLLVRLEAFNVFNHPNFSNPGITFASSTFGVITSAHDPRILQLAVKYLFSAGARSQRSTRADKDR